MDTQQDNAVFVPYSYVVTSGVLAATGASSTQPLLLDADADFELHYLAGTTDLDAATDFRPNNFSVQITDKNNGRLWSSGNVPQVTMLMLETRRPVLLAKRSNLNLNFLSTGASSLTATVVLHGYKVYTS